MTYTVSEDKKMMDILVNNTLNTIMGFRLVIEAETSALNEYDFGKAVGLQEQKEKYSIRYADIIEELSVHTEKLKQLPEDMKKRFRAEHELFSNAVEENKAALLASGKIATRLSNRVITIAKQALTKDGLNYTRYGTAKQSFIKPLHMQVNQTL